MNHKLWNKIKVLKSIPLSSKVLMQILKVQINNNSNILQNNM